MIANLLLAEPVDKPTKLRAAGRSVNYSRFVDDIALSGSNSGQLISSIAKAISRAGLQTWRKLKITPRSERQEVTGYTVNSRNGPSIARNKRDKIRAAIHDLEFVQCQQE